MYHAPADKKAVEALHIWKWGWIADPVYFGDWPNWLKEVLGYRLPAFTQEDKALLKGSFDYFGLNFYDSMFAKSNPGAIPVSCTAPTVVAMTVYMVFTTCHLTKWLLY